MITKYDKLMFTHETRSVSVQDFEQESRDEGPEKSQRLLLGSNSTRFTVVPLAVSGVSSNKNNGERRLQRANSVCRRRRCWESQFLMNDIIRA